MSQSGPGPGRAVSFEQLVALNDEMAALVRAGVPLEAGLAELGRDLPGRLGNLATALSRRMTAGESLGQILASDPQTFPPVWRAVVEAGLRSGQLAAALESMSATARRLSDLRKEVAAALVYPLIVLSLAYALLVFTLTQLTPVTTRAFEDLTGTSDPLMTGLVWLGQTAAWWAPWAPLVAIVLLVVWWRRAGRAAWTRRRRPRAGRPRSGLSLGFALGRVVGDDRLAGFSEVLALLVEQKVPLPQAVLLAAEASGDRGLREAAQQFAGRLERGEILTRREDLPAEFPPTLGWLMASGVPEAELGPMLQRAAGGYRDRAARTSRWAATVLPVALTMLCGGTAVLVQAMVNFLPMWKLLYTLGLPL